MLKRFTSNISIFPLPVTLFILISTSHINELIDKKASKLSTDFWGSDFWFQRLIFSILCDER